MATPPDTDTSENEEVTKDRRKLFKDAMNGNWESVLETYRTKDFAREAKITRAKDTLLHVAVSEGRKDVVQKLVDAIFPTDAVKILRVDEGGNDIPATDDAVKILRMENEGGDTPLHLAAALGMVEVCTILASKSINLIVEARNKNGETPLFVAARYGKKKAFFALQNQIDAHKPPKEKTLSYCRRNDGYTILHIAIYGEHFDLAFEIIHLYPEFVNYNNEMGQSALHLLANKPSVFKSGNRIRRLDNLIYSCVIVNPLKVKYGKEEKKTNKIQPDKKENILPLNYKTCLDLFRILQNAFQAMVDIFHGWSWKNCCNAGDEENPSNTSSEGKEVDEQERIPLPKNYTTCFHFLKIAMKLLLIVLGIGIWRIDKIKRKKQKHTHACQLMDKLVSHASHWAYEEDGRKPLDLRASSIEDVTKEKEGTADKPDGDSQIRVAVKMGILDVLGMPSLKIFCKKYGIPSQSDSSQENKPDGDTPILIAAKMGILEMVKKILETFSVAVQDLDSNHKNIVLLAVEFRQPHVYQYLLLKWKKMRESIFGRVDKDGNSALHLAARIGQSRPWMIPGAALQMQWEIRWYKFVKNSMEPGFFQHYNDQGQTPRDIFTEAHGELVKDGGKWLTNTSQSCSVVAALIATVAFASATTVPGGVRQDSGFPTLEGQPVFDVFAVSALVALCFSVTSLIMFLSVLTSRHDEMDFEKDLPVKLILGLTSLFMSIAAMLVSFCAGHFYVIENKLRYAAYPVYAITCLPITFFAVAHFPLYFDLIKATIARVPERAYKVYRF